MSFVYDSDQIRDNEKRKFQPDSNGEVAVNVKSADIVDAINNKDKVTKTTPTIYNLNCVLANTEYSQVISNNASSLLIRSREASDIRVAFNAGETLTNYVTLKKYAVWQEDNLDTNNLTIFVSSSLPNIVVEILEWV